MHATRIVVAGAAGRMGQTILRSLASDHDCTLAGALELPGHASIGADAGLLGGGDASGITIGSDVAKALQNADALIDFTVPAVSTELAEQAADAGIAHVIGTTGFSAEQEGRIKSASGRAVIVKSGNMSLGANVLAGLVGQAAKMLRDFDVQIVEIHHRMKKDAPSGTALMLGRAAADARGLPLTNAGRAETGIGYASLRGGTVVGEHRVIFAGEHERLILEHVAEDRSIFARGAIAAGKWAVGQKPGLYTMLDVLGFG